MSFTASITGLPGVLRSLQRTEKVLDDSRRLANACYDAASTGAEIASTIYSMSDYDGDRDVSVTARKTDSGATITAAGQSVLFMEFGAGATHSGERHPQNSEFGFGPGTYNPDSPNWSNPKGWWFTDPVTGQKVHTYGNPPAMAMYQAGKEVRSIAVESVRREIFGE